MVQNSDGSKKIIPNVSYIKTELEGTGDKCTWVPKDEIEKNEIVRCVYENGEYRSMLLIPDGDIMHF